MRNELPVLCGCLAVLVALCLNETLVGRPDLRQIDALPRIDRWDLGRKRPRHGISRGPFGRDPAECPLLKLIGEHLRVCRRAAFRRCLPADNSVVDLQGYCALCVFGNFGGRVLAKRLPPTCIEASFALP